MPLKTIVLITMPTNISFVRILIIYRKSAKKNVDDYYLIIHYIMCFMDRRDLLRSIKFLKNISKKFFSYAIIQLITRYWFRLDWNNAPFIISLYEKRIISTSVIYL